MGLSQREQKLGQFLIQKKLLDDLQLSSAVASAEQWGQRLTESLLHLRFIRESTLVDALAELSQAPCVDFRQRQPEPAALALLEADFCKRRGVMPFALSEDGRVLHLAMTDPFDLAVMDEITVRKRVRIRCYVVGELLLQKAIQRFYLGMEHVSLEAAPEEKPVAEVDEIKLVDASGKTLMLTNAVASLKQMMNTPKAPPALAPAPVPSPLPVRPQPISAQPAFAPAVAATPAPPPGEPVPPAATGAAPPLQARIHELERQVAALKQSQTYSERVLRALLDCLLVGGAVKPEELRARMSQYPKGGPGA